jgi:hypothetical protein
MGRKEGLMRAISCFWLSAPGGAGFCLGVWFGWFGWFGLVLDLLAFA